MKFRERERERERDRLLADDGYLINRCYAYVCSGEGLDEIGME